MNRLRPSRTGLAALATLLALAAGPAAAQEPEPAPGGTAVLGQLQEPACLNPYLVHCGGAILTPVVSPVLPGAYRQRPDFSWEPVLVDRVTVTHERPDRWFKLTYRLEEAATWSDGRPVTAHDLAFTLDTLRHPANHVLSREGYERITRTDVLDEKTVRFTFDRPFPAWKTLFPHVLPKHALGGWDFGTVWNDGIVSPATGEPIGSGPFLLTAWERGTRMTLSRNASWWGENAAFLDSVVLRFGFAQAFWSALADGSVDAVDFGSPQLALVGVPGVAAQISSGRALEHLDFNVGSATTPLLREQWFRQAVAHALDREGAATELADLSQVPEVPVQESLVYLGRQDEHRPHFARYAYDPGRVSEIMLGHGCALGDDGVWACGGTRASLRFATTTPNERRARFQARLVASAREAGIELIPDNSSASVLFGTRLPQRDYDLIMFAWVVTDVDPSRLEDLYGCAGGSNFMGYCSEPVTRLLQESDEETRESRRRSYAERAGRILAQDVPSIPLYQSPTGLYSRSRLRGLEDNPAQAGVTWNVEGWWLAES